MNWRNLIMTVPGAVIAITLLHRHGWSYWEATVLLIAIEISIYRWSPKWGSWD